MGWIIVGVVVYLSLMPVPPETPGFDGLDKIAHLLSYAVIMVWFGFCYARGRAYRNLAVIIFLIGVVLEVIQGKTGYRSMSYFDMAANGLGVFLGWLLSGTRLSSGLMYVESRL